VRLCGPFFLEAQRTFWCAQSPKKEAGLMKRTSCFVGSSSFARANTKVIIGINNKGNLISNVRSLNLSKCTPSTISAFAKSQKNAVPSFTSSQPARTVHTLKDTAKSKNIQRITIAGNRFGFLPPSSMNNVSSFRSVRPLCVTTLGQFQTLLSLICADGEGTKK